MQSKIFRNGSFAALFALMLMSLLLTFSLAPASVQAQAAEPTATPRDPAWLGYVQARTAIEEEKNINLAVIQRWDFWQDDWTTPNASHPERAAGIDSCVSTVGIAQGRPVYFGWTYVITALSGTRYEARVSFDLREVAICDILTTAAAATAAPASGTPSNLPAPVAGSAATGSFELGGHVTNMNANAIGAMTRAGMRWAKQQLPISAGIGQGQNYITATHNAGFKILIGLVGDRAALAADPVGYANSFAAFAAQLATAGADAIEVWNEPNIDREWPTGQISGANYTALLAVTYNAIKTANPNTMVISGAPAPTGFFGAAGCNANGCNDDTFMQQMAAAGAARYLDCVGIHYNEGIVSPSTYSNDPRSGGDYPTYFFGSMINRAAAPFPNKPICFTELGYLSGEGMGSPIPANFDWTPQDPITVAEQAAWLAEAATLSAQRGNIRIMIVWNVDFTRWDTDPMGGYAMIRPNGTCPACDTLGAVMKK